MTAHPAHPHDRHEGSDVPKIEPIRITARRWTFSRCETGLWCEEDTAGNGHPAAIPPESRLAAVLDMIADAAGLTDFRLRQKVLDLEAKLASERELASAIAADMASRQSTDLASKLRHANIENERLKRDNHDLRNQVTAAQLPRMVVHDAALSALDSCTWTEDQRKEIAAAIDRGVAAAGLLHA
jgi:hypothetical protein